MQSKSMIIVLLSALLLNIFHDFIIAEQQLKCQSHSTLLTQSTSSALGSAKTGSFQDTCCSELDEWHHVFHFSGILTSFYTLEGFEKLSSTLLFINNLIPYIFQENTFKPPRS